MKLRFDFTKEWARGNVQGTDKVDDLDERTVPLAAFVIAQVRKVDAGTVCLLDLTQTRGIAVLAHRHAPGGTNGFGGRLFPAWEK